MPGAAENKTPRPSMSDITNKYKSSPKVRSKGSQNNGKENNGAVNAVSSLDELGGCVEKGGKGVSGSYSGTSWAKSSLKDVGNSVESRGGGQSSPGGYPKVCRLF